MNIGLIISKTDSLSWIEITGLAVLGTLYFLFVYVVISEPTSPLSGLEGDELEKEYL
jgi:hypothetical protein